MAKGLQTRERILDTAFRLAARDGLEGLSLAGLASELGMSKSGLFAHFLSKEELQLEMLRVASERFTEKVMRPSFRQPRGLPRLRALFENWRRWATDPSLPGGCVFVAAAAELDDRPGPVRDRLVSLQKGWLEVMATVYRTGVQERHFRRDVEPDEFAHDVYSTMLGFHHAARLLRDPRAEARANAAFERLLSTVRRDRRTA